MIAPSRLWRALPFLLLLTACAGRAEPPRPDGLPADAWWLGGPDGGAYVALTPDTVARRFAARIFHQNGEPWYSGPVLLEPDTAAPVDARDHAAFEAWDGERLLLGDGRSLRAVP